MLLTCGPSGVDSRIFPNIPVFLLLCSDAQLLDSSEVDVTELARVQCF